METETIRIEKLQEASQFSAWKFQVRVILISNEIFDVVSGDEKKPEPAAANASVTVKAEADKAISDWKKKDAKAQKIIVTSLSQKMILHVLTCTTAKSMWEKLHSVFEQKNAVGKQHLQQQFFSLEKDTADDMATHISKVEMLVHQLKELDVNIDDGMVVTKVLGTLPQEYKHFVSAWDSIAQDQQTMANLTSRLMIEESRMKSSEACSALMAKRVTADKKKNQKQTKQRGKCFKCGSTEHWKRDCDADKSSIEKKNSSSKSEKSNESKALVCVSTASTAKIENWYIDSGATHHMSNQRQWFRDYVDFSVPERIKIGNGDYMEAVGRGNIDILAFNGSSWISKTLVNAVYVPSGYANLFSQGKTLDNGYTLVANSKGAKIYDGEEILAMAERQGGLYKMLFKVIEQKEEAMANLAIKKNSLQMWHERLSHQNVQYVRDFLRKRNIDFIDEDFDCDGCAYGKLHRLSFELRREKSNACGQIIHADLCGAFQVNSLGGSRYFLLLKMIIHIFERYTF